MKVRSPLKVVWNEPLVGTRALPVSELSMKSQLETLVDAILRESAIGKPQVHDANTVKAHLARFLPHYTA